MGSILGLLGLAIMVIAGIASLIFGIQLLIRAFQTSVLWGLGSLFVPFVGLIFVIMYWERAKEPFLKYLVAALVMGVGMGISAVGAGMSH